MLAATPAPVQNEAADDDDDEPLNEDDDEDLDDVDQGDDLSATHLVLAQFDKVLNWTFIFMFLLMIFIVLFSYELSCYS